MDRSIVLFDGVCNLCNSSINFIIDHDPKMNFQFAALQSEEGQKILSENHVNPKFLDSVVLFEGGKHYTRSTAALKVAKNLSGAWPAFYFLFIWWPPFIRDAMYNLVAKYRYKLFGRTEACRMPTPELKQRFLSL